MNMRNPRRSRDLDLSVPEVANYMSCAEGTAKSHLHKAIANLRAYGLVTKCEMSDRDQTTPGTTPTEEP